MKVAIITHYWKNSFGGGILSYLTGLIDELRKNGIYVKVVFKEGIDQSNYRIPGHRYLFPLKAFWILRKIKPEVVHSQGAWYCIFSGYLYKKVYGARLICTEHTSSGNRKPPFYQKIIMRFLRNQCDYFTFVSEALKNENEAHGFVFRNCKITYAGVTPKEVTKDDIEEFRHKFGLKEGSIVLLAQGLTANKLKAEGAKLLIKAVGDLKNKYSNMILILTREGIYSTELKEFVTKLELNDKVIFTGNVDNPYTPLAVSNIYAHISLSEGGLSMAILEAMSVGKPIIGTSVGGIPEAISNMQNGILVKPDTEEIAKAIEKLLVDKELATILGENAKKTVLENFTWEISAKRFIELYEAN